MEVKYQERKQMLQTTANPPQVKETSSLSMLATMGSVGCMAGVLIVMTYQLTFDRIQRQKQQYLLQSVFEVLPGTKTVKNYKVENGGQLAPTKDQKGLVVYAGYTESGKLTGVAIESHGQGFQDILRVLYGYSPEKQCIIGMKVLESKETPGLGDKIEKDAHFLENFRELDVSLDAQDKAVVHPIEVVKLGSKTQKWQIDAITGATISSKAIGNILRASSTKMAPLIRKNLARLKGER